MVTFNFQDSNGNSKDIIVSFEEIAEQMEDFVNEKLANSFCSCNDEDSKDCDCYEEADNYNLSLVSNS